MPVTSLKDSLSLIGVELPHTLAFIDYLNENRAQHTGETAGSSNRNSLLTSCTTKQEVLNSVDSRPIDRLDTVRSDDHVIRKPQKLTVRRRSINPRAASHIVDAKFSSLLDKLNHHKNSSSETSSGRRTSSWMTEILETSSNKENRLTWNPRISDSVRASERSFDTKASENAKSMMAATIGRRHSKSVSVVTATDKPLGRHWIGSYRMKPISKVVIPACFV